MVDPDVARVLDFNEILTLGGVVEIQVPENNVRDLLDAETTACQTRARAGSENGCTADQVDNWDIPPLATRSREPGERESGTLLTAAAIQDARDGDDAAALSSGRKS